MLDALAGVAASRCSGGAASGAAVDTSPLARMNAAATWLTCSRCAKLVQPAGRSAEEAPSPTHAGSLTAPNRMCHDTWKLVWCACMTATSGASSEPPAPSPSAVDASQAHSSDWCGCSPSSGQLVPANAKAIHARSRGRMPAMAPAARAAAAACSWVVQAAASAPSNSAVAKASHTTAISARSSTRHQHSTSPAAAASAPLRRDAMDVGATPMSALIRSSSCSAVSPVPLPLSSPSESSMGRAGDDAALATSSAGSARGVSTSASSSTMRLLSAAAVASLLASCEGFRRADATAHTSVDRASSSARRCRSST